MWYSSQLLSDMQEGGVVEVDYFEEPVEEPGEELHGKESQVTSTPCHYKCQQAGAQQRQWHEQRAAEATEKEEAASSYIAHIKTVIDEQRLLRQSFEASRAREFALREREIVLQETAIKVQQELATALMAS